MKERIIELLNKNCGTKAPRKVFCDWVEMMALYISNTTKSCSREVWEYRRKQCRRILNEYGKTGIEKFVAAMLYLKDELEQTPDNVLGEIYARFNVHDKNFAQYFTPPHIADLFSELALHNPNDEEVIFEPCCGSGNFCLGAIRYMESMGLDYKHKVLFKAQDIDMNCVHMTYVQLSLLGAKGFVYQDDYMDKKPLKDEQCFITPQLAEALRQEKTELKGGRMECTI